MDCARESPMDWMCFCRGGGGSSGFVMHAKAKSIQQHLTTQNIQLVKFNLV